MTRKECARELADGYCVWRDVTVYRVDCGEAVGAVTYVARPERVKDGLTPAREYLEHLLAGADCLSKEYQERLRAIDGLE